MDLQVGEKEEEEKRLSCRAVVEVNWLLHWLCCFSHPAWVKGNSGEILGCQVPTKPKAKQGLVQDTSDDEVGLGRWKFKVCYYEGISLQLVRG